MTAESAFDAEARASFTDAVRRFVDDRYDFATQRSIAAGDSGYGDTQWREMADLGWLALPIGVEDGGLGGGLTEAVIVMEAAGRGLLLEPLLVSPLLCAGLIAVAATEAQRVAWLPAIAAGDAIFAFAHTAVDQPVIASATGAGYRLSGRKTLVLHGDIADQLLVSAVLKGVETLFHVEANAEGVGRSLFKLIDDRGIAEIMFNGASATLLPGGAAAIAAGLDRATVGLCADGVGAIAALNELTLAFAKTRKQFGQPIGNFQVIQHRLVDMAVAEQQVRSITAAAAAAVDAGHPQARLVVSAAKIAVNKAARFVGESAIQLHGGIGLSNELSAGHYLKRLLVTGSLFGDDDFHLERLAAG